MKFVFPAHEIKVLNLGSYGTNETLAPAEGNCQYVPGSAGFPVEKEAVSDFEIFPNPATDILYYKTQKSGTIQIFDYSGREILKRETNGNLQINISEIPEGSYFILFSQFDRLIDIQKFMVK